MNTSNNNPSNIHDLPNEILFIIANKLNIADVYSLIDIDERFAEIILDPIYIRNIRNIDMTIKTMKSYFDYTFSIDDQVLSRIYEKIVPQIHDHVNKLTIEQNSIERIFTFNYPQLYSLSLINVQEEVFFQYLKDHSILRDLLTDQVTHLNIDIQNETTSQLSEIASNIFSLILSLTKRLTHLNFCQVFSHRKTCISISRLSAIVGMPSCLTQLKINVESFSDCLYLLDGRLDSLSKLIINVNEVSNVHKPSRINGPVELPKLKYFSMTLNNYQQEYDARLIALLNRMINLEELILFLLVTRINSTYIDGIQLYDDILIYMPQLNKFAFSINTGVIIEKSPKRLQSNEDIQNSFIGRRYGQVGSYVFYQPMTNVGHCHIYSLPYEFEHFFGLNNSFHFQHGIFDKVQRVTMNDSRPFEHEFFKLTSYYFPCLKELKVYNYQPQKDKKHSSTLIIFPHLVLLDLVFTHVDYIKQFLLAKNTHLPCLLDLCITYESLTMLTKNFITDPIHFNCAQVKKLHINNTEPYVPPKTFHNCSSSDERNIFSTSARKNTIPTVTRGSRLKSTIGLNITEDEYVLLKLKEQEEKKDSIKEISCFATTYKQNADFLLFLNDQYTPYGAALSPVNERLRSPSYTDAWLQWVKERVDIDSNEQSTGQPIINDATKLRSFFF